MDIVFAQKSFQANPVSLKASFKRVDGHDFAKCIADLRSSEQRFAENLSFKDDYSDYHCWLLDDGSRGFAVGPYLDLTNVFSRKACGDKAQGILDCAKANYGKLFLNCFSGKNEQIYQANGFTEMFREANWNGSAHPDIVFMQWSRSP